MYFYELINEVERLNTASKIFGISERINYKSSRTEKLHKYGNSFRAHLPSKEDKEKNGIYCFLNREKEILYIGKAASGNISREMFAKIPKPVVVDKKNDIATFENNYWAGSNLPQHAIECISKGEFYIGFILLESSEVTSKMETYLQVIYSMVCNGKLPPLNKRVG